MPAATSASRHRRLLSVMNSWPEADVIQAAPSWGFTGSPDARCVASPVSAMSQPTPTAPGPNSAHGVPGSAMCSISSRVLPSRLAGQPDLDPAGLPAELPGRGELPGRVAALDGAARVALDLVAAAGPQIARDRQEPPGDPHGVGAGVPDVGDRGGVDLADDHGVGLARVERAGADPPAHRVDLLDDLDHDELPARSASVSPVRAAFAPAPGQFGGQRVQVRSPDAPERDPATRPPRAADPGSPRTGGGCPRPVPSRNRCRAAP